LTVTSCQISVVIPTRNRWHLLSTAALPSALGQENVDHEVIVVVDGSSDETVERLAALDQPRLRVLEHEESRGVAGARNAGIGAAGGEWIAFLDDDDLWSPLKLRAQLEAVDSARAGFGYGAAAWLDERRAFLRILSPPEPAGLVLQVLRWNVIWAGCSNVIARRDLLQQLGGFDERLFQLADWDLWIRLALAAPAAACEDVVVGYVMQPQSMLLTDRRDVFQEFDYMLEKHADAARRCGVELDGSKFSRWVALGHLRAGRRRDAARTYLGGAFRYRDPGSAVRAIGALLGPDTLPFGRAVLGAVRGDTGDARSDGEPAWLQRYR
jgi:glycosyltransferase involved in cell wall biosynthesis